MSKNRNRTSLSKCSTSREYKQILLKKEYDYCIVCSKRCGSIFYDCSPMSMKRKGRHGSGKIVSTFDARAYRSWKHNRHRQYK